MDVPFCDIFAELIEVQLIKFAGRAISAQNIHLAKLEAELLMEFDHSKLHQFYNLLDLF